MFDAKSAPDEFTNQTQRINEAPKLWQISHFPVNHTAIILGAGARQKLIITITVVSTIFSRHIIDLYHHDVNMGRLTLITVNFTHI